MKARLRPFASTVRRTSTRPPLSAGQLMVGQPPLDGRPAPELGGDVGPCAAFAHDIGLAAFTESQLQGVDQDRLAGAGFAGQHREAGRELKLERVDDHEVANRKRNQHSRRGRGVQARECGSLGITLQCSFWRSVAKKL